MSQQPVRSCPQCGTPAQPGQRFCSNCGATVGEGSQNVTELTPNKGLPPSHLTEIETQHETPPPPPPGGQPTQYAQPPQSYPQQGQQGGYQQQPGGYQSPPPGGGFQQQGGYQSPPPGGGFQPQAGGYQPPPTYARPVKDSTGSVLTQFGCGIVVVILVILALCGGAGYFVYQGLRSAAKDTGTTSVGSSSSNTVNNDVTPTIEPPTTTPLNAVVTFASVKMTFINAQQVSRFTDDVYTNDGKGALRLNYKEENTSSRSPSYNPSQMMRLQLPDGTIIQPLSAQSDNAPAASVTRNNWVDFPLSKSIKASQTTLILGLANQAQMTIPLTGKADLTKYQAKTATPNKTVPYQNVSWTVTTATTEFSYNAQQADKDMMYVVVDMKIDNNSDKYFSAYYGDYIRLQSGDTKASPTDCTIPTTVDAGKTNATGTCWFAMPQNSSNFTLLLLGNTATGVQEASIAF